MANDCEYITQLLLIFYLMYHYRYLVKGALKGLIMATIYVNAFRIVVEILIHFIEKFHQLLKILHVRNHSVIPLGTRVT